MVTGTTVIVLLWVVFTLPLWANIVLTIVCALWILFWILFTVYFFNLDMKLLSAMQSWLIKRQDKKKKQRRI